MSKTFDELKAELLQIKEELEMKDIIKKLDKRKKEVKEELKLHKKLTKSVKKAGKQMPGSLDFNSPENMYYSDKEVNRILEDTSYMDAYNASKLDQEWN
mgnify:FL=1|tara:strand:- start:215 stop:511 length:297 start_codon:yes stop_codon:yes gene_type:complete